jgi:hypothetical protein
MRKERNKRKIIIDTWKRVCERREQMKRRKKEGLRERGRERERHTIR